MGPLEASAVDESGSAALDFACRRAAEFVAQLPWPTHKRRWKSASGSGPRYLLDARRWLDDDHDNKDETVTDSQMVSRGDGLALPRALALNRFDVRCPGVHKLTRLARPESKDARRALESRLGQAIFVTDDFAYTVGEIAEGSPVELGCDFDRLVHQFDLREALALQARERGFGAWFGRGGELHVVGLPGGRTIDGIVVQRRLRLRLTAEEDQTSLTGRHGTRWITAALSDPTVRSRAVGETAVCLSDGHPRRGEVVRSDGSATILRVGSDEIEVASSDYVISASAAYVRRHHGPQTLQNLQIASGSMTTRGQRNRYAVKDRFAALLEDMDALGWAISLGFDRAAVIEREWTEIRVQEGT